MGTADTEQVEHHAGESRLLIGAPAGAPSASEAPDKEASERSGVLARITMKIPLASSRIAARAAIQEDAGTSGHASRTSRPPRSAHPKGNFLTYARSRMDTFEARSLGEVDSLVFSWLSYYRLASALRGVRTAQGCALHELLRAEDFTTMFGTSWDPEGSRELLFAACASPRFRQVRPAFLAYRTDRATSEQFAAVTFLLPGGGAYVAFRGTDSTLVGWREDFNMASTCPVPSQLEAAQYLERVSSYIEGPLYVGGHSKGGNLAVYAAAMCPEWVQRRIVRIFSHDGPGFDNAFREGEAYQRILDRVEKTVPKSSVIGLIMDAEGDFTVVESGGISVYQHNPFLWEVEGTSFTRADGLSASSRYLGQTIEAWMARFTPEERGEFIRTMFDVLSVTGATRLADIRENWKTSLPAIREAASALDPERRAFVFAVLKALARVATIERVREGSDD